MVTCSIEKARAFLRHHKGALCRGDLELLVFCEEMQEAVLSAEIANSCGNIRIFFDGVKSGPNRKRNVLAKEARGRFLIFLDDDSFVASPETAIPMMIEILERTLGSWFLTSVRYEGEFRKIERLPIPFGEGFQGSGIEWNQIISREAFQKVGGWDEAFCTGERWKSGGMLSLMFKLHAAGYRQFPVPDVWMEHPLQVEDTTRAALKKGLRYRFATGAVVCAQWCNISLRGKWLWTARLWVAPWITWLPSLLQRRYNHALVRILSPAATLAGFISYFMFRRNLGFPVK